MKKEQMILFSRSMRTRATWCDALLALLCISAAMLCLLPHWIAPRGASITVAYAGARANEVFSLSEDREIFLEHNGYHLTLIIENGTAFVRESDCPDRVCQSRGEIARNGDTIVCAPAGISVTVHSEEKGGDADAIAG